MRELEFRTTVTFETDDHTEQVDAVVSFEGPEPFAPMHELTNPLCYKMRGLDVEHEHRHTEEETAELRKLVIAEWNKDVQDRCGVMA